LPTRATGCCSPLRVASRGINAACFKPKVVRLKGDYPKTKIPEAEWKQLQTRLERSPTLPKYDITIRPKRPRGR